MAAPSAPPAAAALTVLLSVGASAPGLLWGVPAGRSAALRPAALHDGEVHRLITYIFIYEDLISLACGAVIIWYFAGSFEKNVGTVKHCILTATFSVLSALLYLFLQPLVSRLLQVGDAKGFMPVAFATLGVSTTRSRMRSTLLFGCRVPVVLVPWLGLCIAWFVPHSSLLGNLCGLLVGEAYGLGYCFCLDFPDSVGSKLDRVFPFTLLRRIPGLKYIPGSLAERRASENSRIIPVPGTYPTQSYHCPSPLALPAHPGAQSQSFHPSHTPGHGLTLGHQAPQQGCAAGHSLSSSHCQARGAFGECSGQCCQLGKFPVPQPPAATGPLPGVQQAPGYPATPVAPVSAEFTRVQVY
ncbi:rhomboid domain-containing protein 2 isoform X1 [Oenanthe melanoleuca]|uniref:rhomboid domain-containing protein 2 isoform X1 n=1 Tax=Oenanthe melanoleuca TaxID=2939378 RepID=UPI0024C1E2D6|nr:rhomboid domain-containing protein 2 isoform X1 [Oenanthe melanoleuca]